MNESKCGFCNTDSPKHLHSEDVTCVKCGNHYSTLIEHDIYYSELWWWFAADGQEDDRETKEDLDRLFEEYQFESIILSNEIYINPNCVEL